MEFFLIQRVNRENKKKIFDYDDNINKCARAFHLLGVRRLLAIEFMMSNRMAKLRSGLSALVLARRPIDRPDSTSCTALLSCLEKKKKEELIKITIPYDEFDVHILTRVVGVKTLG